MKRANGKSHCAVNFALEAIGDPWSLLIVRDIALNGKHTSKEFLESEEHIATNILVNRLTQLESYGIIAKQRDPLDKRVTTYALTEKGINLIPALLELSKWSAKYDPKTDANKVFAEEYYKNPTRVTVIIQDAVRNGRAAFAGRNSVVDELGIH